MNILKKISIRFVVGGAVGILLGYLIALSVSLGMSEGEYIPAMHSLQALCKTELQAVLVQTLLTALIGIVFAQAGFLFELEHWSFLKQCVVHFFATVIFYLPFSMICWFPLQWESLAGILCSVLLTYSITYVINYKLWCREIARINELVLQKRREEKRESDGRD